MNKDLPKDYIKNETETCNMNRWAEPVEIANVVVFLASDKASYITGQVIVVNGGKD